jgi:hypothetical protein
MSTPDPAIIEGLGPLIRRVRQDVSAVKKSNGEQAWTNDRITKTLIAQHLNGGPPRGVCPIKAGESTTMVALLDFDSHKGEISWTQMSAVVGQVVETLQMIHGMEPVLFRSSGGLGVHLYLLWDAPQDAYSVREFMKGVLAACGLRSGTGGLIKNQVEIFPKQDSVAADGFGNQFILPLANLSLPLQLTDEEPLW